MLASDLHFTILTGSKQWNVIYKAVIAYIQPSCHLGEITKKIFSNMQRPILNKTFEDSLKNELAVRGKYSRIRKCG